MSFGKRREIPSVRPDFEEELEHLRNFDIVFNERFVQLRPGNHLDLGQRLPGCLIKMKQLG
jgi:hypothetical protein